MEFGWGVRLGLVGGVSVRGWAGCGIGLGCDFGCSRLGADARGWWEWGWWLGLSVVGGRGLALG